MKNWYEWDSVELFDIWHNAKMEELNLPQIPVNQFTGFPNKKATRTTSYTIPFEVEGKIIAVVEDEHADGLTITALRLPEPISPINDL